MTKKLTKNDSMLSRSEKHDVAVAAFEALLNKYGAHKEYFDEFRKYNKCDIASDTFCEWRSWAKMTDPLFWLKDAFVWNATDRDFPFWYRISVEWSGYYMQHLNS